MARIAVVGSVARDEVVRLDTPVTPGTHLEGRALAPRLGGGAANTGIALAHGGHQVAMVAALGTDASGDAQLADLEAAGVQTALVRRVPGDSTRSILLVDPQGERTVVNLGRVAEPQPPARLLSAEVDLVYVRARALDLAPILAEKANRCPIVAHIPPLEAGSRPAQILLGSASDLDDAFLADPFAAGRAVAGDLLEWVVITRGPDGALATNGTDTLTAPAPTVDVVDSTGCGDAFAAGLLHALAAGTPMATALTTGVAWGSAKAGHDSSILPPTAVAELVRLGG